MLKKHHLAVLAFLAALLGIAATDSINGVHNASQPPTARTNAPGETTCTGCHTGTLNSGPGSLSLTGLPAGGYIPGQVYTLTASVNATASKYGFEITALRTTNAMAGSFALTSPTTTSLGTATVSGGSRSYVGHKTANTTSSWSFNWTAPSTAVGTVTFYMAGNAANGTGGTGGDAIYASTFAVAQAPAPTADFTTSSTTICAGSSITFTDASTGSPTGYSWNFGNGQTATAAGPHTITFGTAGNFTVSLTATNAVGSNTKTVNVTVNPAPVPVIQATQIDFCAGQSTVLSTVASYSSYTWSSGSTAATQTTDSTTCQTVTVTDGNGCTATSAQFCVTEHPLPSVGIFPSQIAFCEGDSSLISASLPHTAYLWSNGATSSHIWVKETDTITLIATNALGCSDTSNELIVTMLPNPVQPQITPANPAWCAGGGDTLAISGQYASVLWSNQATGLSNPISQPGNYFVTVTDANGCTSTSDTITAVENPLPMIVVSGPTTFCAGGSATLCGPFALSGTALWSTGDTTLCISVSQTDTVTLAFTDQNGCTGVSAPFITTQGLNLSPVLLVNGQPSGDSVAFCAGDSLLLTVGQFASYLWSNGDTTSTLVVDATGDFSVTVGDGAGCTGSTFTLHATENPLPVVDFEPSGMGELSATIGFVSYQWFIDSNLVSNENGSIWVQAALQSGNIRVCATDTNGCTACSDEKVIIWESISNALNEKVVLAPNPTRDQVAISLKNMANHEVAAATVSDLAGRVVLSLVPAAEMVADLSALAPGTYLVQIRLMSGAVVSAPVVRN